MDTVRFQRFLDEFAKQVTKLKTILVFDNTSWMSPELPLNYPELKHE